MPQRLCSPTGCAPRFVPADFRSLEIWLPDGEVKQLTAAGKGDPVAFVRKLIARSLRGTRRRGKAVTA